MDKLQLLNDSLYAEITGLRLFALKKNRKLQTSLFRYLRKLQQCNLIINRILESLKQYEELDKKYRSETRYLKDGRLNPEQQKLRNSFSNLTFQIGFDIEDYCIHVKVLLDRITIIVGNLLPELPMKSKRDFTKHRLYFIKNDCSDLIYSKFIREKTKWYDIMLLVFRNDLIIHDEITSSHGGLYSRKSYTISRMKDVDKDEAKEIMKQLNEIKKSHKNDISDLAKEETLWGILKILDNNAENLDEKEIKTVFGIHKKIGGQLPFVNNINKKVQELISFVGNHFRKNAP